MHPLDRTKKEIDYIVNHLKYKGSLALTDSNFGMFKEDILIAKFIEEKKKNLNWPKALETSTGKNKPEILKEIVKILNKTILVGVSIQTSDSEVLKNIKRNNISTELFKEFIKFNKHIDKNCFTFTEIILGLPGDTLIKHFESLKYGINMRVTNVKSFQAMMLNGSHMNESSIRKKYKIKTGYRVIPGCIGNYTFGNKNIKIIEFDEIILRTDSLSFKDYINCRVMDLLVEVFYNNSLCEEIFKLLSPEEIFDSILYLYNNQDLFSSKIRKLIKEFKDETEKDIFISKEMAKKYILEEETFNKYLDGKLGINELMTYKVLLFNEIDDILESLIKSVNKVKNIDIDFLKELKEFIICRKKSFYILSKPIIKGFKYNFSNNKLEPTSYKFYHTKEQKERINIYLNLYEKDVNGIGRLFQRCNLNDMYRKYKIINE
jgi:hypothetical protein